MEIKAFGEALPGGTPCHSVKGGIGHTLGAAGVIEAAIAVKSLATGLVPPTVGLLEPAAVGGGYAGRETQPLRHPSVLSCNSGFGGINAAVLLSRPAKM
jgi:3-oxoacyl-(acyl-carrier-protein) synthase